MRPYANPAAAALLGLPGVHEVLTADASDLVGRFEIRHPDGRPVSEDELPGARVPAKIMPPEDVDLVMVDQPNSIALRMALVAADEADLVATLRWGFEWDIGAAALIAREAGATVTDAFGGPLNYNKPDPRAFGLLVTAPTIHAAAVARLADRAKVLAAKG